MLTRTRIHRDLAFGLVVATWAVPAAPEVLWLTEGGTWGNAFELVARADTGYPTVTPDGLTLDEAIEMLFACQSVGCPRVGGIYEQRFIEPIGALPFNRTVVATDADEVPTLGSFRNSVEASQTDEFDGLTMRSVGRMRASNSDAPGAQARSRAVGQSGGQLQFRVRDGKHAYIAQVSYELGQPGAFGTYGAVQMVWIPNTGAGGIRAANWMLRQDTTERASGQYSHGVLDPGLYRLQWGIGLDGRIAEQYSNEYRFEMTFQPCDRVARPAGLSEPFDTLDEAAQAALAAAWQQVGQQQGVEYGGALYRAQKYYYVAPIVGQVGADGVARVGGASMQAKFLELAPYIECQGTQADVVGTYHTHPGEDDPTYLSSNDLNAAIYEQRTVFMRGANGERCGIHKFAPGVQHRTLPLTPAEGEYLTLSRARRLAEERGDERGKDATWIGLTKESPPPERCDYRGRSVTQPPG